MGSWGTYPKDSDGALDLFGDICDLVNDNFHNIAKDYSGYNYAGAVMLLLQKGFHVNRDWVKNARDYVKQELIDVDNRGWKDPEKTKQDMKIVLDGFDELLKDKTWKGKTILAPLGWLERKGDKEKENWSGLGYV